MTACLDENAALQLLEGKPSASRGAVERHLEQCDACRELIAELAQIEGAPSESEPPPGADRLRFSGVTLAMGDHIGPYRVERAIGQGAAGTVYRATDTRTNAVVAVKLLTDPALRSRFAREAEILARLDHPGIVRYLGHGEAPGGLYLAMEWLDGEDLSHRLERGALDWPSARTLGMRVAAALGHAHALGCVHRDLSPKNVFLPNRQFDQAKLLDFGLVRVPDPGLDRTTSQAALGTPFYMAPEQVRDPKSVDLRADLFGLGVLLFEAISGRRPFEADDLFTLWIRIVDQPTPDLRTMVPSAPEAFIRVIEHLLAKDPNGRPRSAAEVESALTFVDAAIPAMPALAIAAAPVPPNRGVVLMKSIAIGGAVALCLAIGGVYTEVSQRAIDAVAGASDPAHAPADGNGARLDDEGKRGPNTENPDDSEKADLNDAREVAPSHAIVTAVDAGKGKGHRDGGKSSHVEAITCGGSDVDTRRNGHYAPRDDSAAAITAGGECELALEDCLIEGPRSLNVLNKAVVTLRRCTVKGEVGLVGGPTLHLYDTELPSPPRVVGKGKVVRH